MTTVFLVRHASHDLLGRVLAGRMAGVRLSSQGRDEARRVGQRLAREPLAAVHSSPVDRAWETAEGIAAPHGIAVTPAEALNEIDFGAWTGAEFVALEADPRWSTWNAERSRARPPGGESMLEAQLRATRHLLAICEQYRDTALAFVTHQDIIKAVLAHLLGLSLDSLHRFEVSPASVSTVASAMQNGT